MTQLLSTFFSLSRQCGLFVALLYRDNWRMTRRLGKHLICAYALYIAMVLFTSLLVDEKVDTRREN
jgi:hypothetical protein